MQKQDDLQHKAPAVLHLPPKSLSVAPPSTGNLEDDDEISASVGKNSWFRRLLKVLGYYSNEAFTIRGATNLYEAITIQADTDGLHDAMKLPPSFYSRWCALERAENVLLKSVRFQHQFMSVRCKMLNCLVNQ
jgi:hypothetical protein